MRSVPKFRSFGHPSSSRATRGQNPRRRRSPASPSPPSPPPPAAVVGLARAAVGGGGGFLAHLPRPLESPPPTPHRAPPPAFPGGRRGRPAVAAAAGVVALRLSPGTALPIRSGRLARSGGWWAAVCRIRQIWPAWPCLGPAWMIAVWCSLVAVVWVVLHVSTGCVRWMDAGAAASGGVDGVASSAGDGRGCWWSATSAVRAARSRWTSTTVGRGAPSPGVPASMKSNAFFGCVRSSG